MEAFSSWNFETKATYRDKILRYGVECGLRSGGGFRSMQWLIGRKNKKQKKLVRSPLAEKKKLLHPPLRTAWSSFFRFFPTNLLHPATQRITTKQRVQTQNKTRPIVSFVPAFVNSQSSSTMARAITRIAPPPLLPPFITPDALALAPVMHRCWFCPSIPSWEVGGRSTLV